VEIPFNIPADRKTRLLFTSGGTPPVAPNTEVIKIPPADHYTLHGDLFSAAVLSGGGLPIPSDDAIGNMRAIEMVLAADGLD